jgi:hypothetical protein
MYFNIKNYLKKHLQSHYQIRSLLGVCVLEESGLQTSHHLKS